MFVVSGDSRLLTFISALIVVEWHRVLLVSSDGVATFSRSLKLTRPESSFEAFDEPWKEEYGGVEP